MTYTNLLPLMNILLSIGLFLVFTSLAILITITAHKYYNNYKLEIQNLKEQKEKLKQEDEERIKKETHERYLDKGYKLFEYKTRKIGYAWKPGCYDLKEPFAKYCSGENYFKSIEDLKKFVEADDFELQWYREL